MRKPFGPFSRLRHVPADLESVGGPLSLFGLGTPQAFGHLGFIPLTDLVMRISRTFRRQ